jgi:glycosyltransferase involved in cell wall biosynthesis
MAGSGDMLNQMIRRVAKLKIADRFHFTGFLQGDAVDRMFALTDVFVMPSVSEPFGLVPLEAMRINVPVIVSKQSGVAEVLKHAIKVDFWDVNGTADAIWGLLHYDSLSKMFIKYGKNEVDNLKWEFSAVKIMDVYWDAVSNRG